jgi:methionine-rich copper-binding protein CopC
LHSLLPSLSSLFPLRFHLHFLELLSNLSSDLKLHQTKEYDLLVTSTKYKKEQVGYQEVESRIANYY